MARSDKPEDIYAEWLGEFLRGQAPTVRRLQEVMQAVGESVHLDYKAAK